MAPSENEGIHEDWPPSRCCGLDPLDRAVYTLSSKYFSFLIFQDAVYELATAVYLVNLPKQGNLILILS